MIKYQNNIQLLKEQKHYKANLEIIKKFILENWILHHKSMAKV